LVCKDKHDMPRNGFIINKSLSKILAIELSKVSRGESYDSLENLLDEIKKKLNLMKLGIDNGIDLVKQHCIDLRSDVQLKTEEIIQQVNDISSKIIEKIDEYEKELIEINKTNHKSLDVFGGFFKELESFFNLNTEYLKRYEVDDKVLKKSNEEATNLIKKAELEIENLKNIIFDGNTLEFKRNNEKINENVLGVTKSNKMIESYILSDRNQVKDLLSLCEFPVDQKLDLIYRASNDGFEAINFHSKCDNKQNTLVIIKSTNGNVFGGYTEQTWNSIDGYKADPNSFIFSLINKDNKPIKIKWSQNKGICCDDIHGPSFGGGCDLRIADKSNSNTNSRSNLGHSYIHPDYAYGSTEAKSFLAGSYNFQVSEIEVFTKQ